MPIEIVVVKASHVIPFIEYLDCQSIPVDDLFTELGLQREQFSSPNNLIPEASIYALLDIVANKYNLVDIGFSVTDKLSLDSFGVFGEQVMQVDCLGTALNSFIEQMGQQSNCPPFWLTNENNGVWFCRLGTQGIKVGHWQIEQHVVSMMTLLVRAFTKQRWFSPQIKLQTANLTGLQSNHYIHHSNVSLKQKVTAIWIPKELLSNKLEITKKFKNIANNASVITKKNSPLIKTIMVQGKEVNSANAEKVAKSLGVNIRTLQRLLQQDGTSFRQVSDEIMFKKAKNLLLVNNLSILQVGLELGYTEAANFTRAFKRWSGKTPTEYKQSI